jgi:pimeloyl-ACP methyl ester carboxylesterase
MIVVAPASNRMLRRAARPESRPMTTPILLVPGLNCTAEVYKHQLPRLWLHGPVTVANHQAGASMAEIASHILAEAPPRFALAGFSMGGYLAFEILRQARDRVTRLALLDTSARADSPEATAKRLAAIALSQQGRFNLAVSQTFPNAVHPDHVANEELKALHLGMAMWSGPEVYARHQQAIIARPDSRPDLPGIAVPTLVVVGEADAITPVDAAREMAAGIHNSRLVIVPRAGHLALVEQHFLVTSALVEWLAAG